MNARAIDLAGLYVSEQSKLRRLINRIVGNRTTTEDLIQDTFVNLMGPSAKVIINDEKAYLARVARNLAIDHRRKQRPLVSLEDAELFALADSTPSAETVVADRQALLLTFEILASLPERTRKAFEMHRLGEHTLAEIARTLGMSNAHAGRLVLEGYRAVRDRLRAQGIE
ncbi:sigma-70 family RNA polymerase sigma factor [Bradyrhizobium sp. dw_78]|uniref:RNA polymerase sigma factor n=1 Tax=Bradyrhizobium sp. dw_78 TaxID=2719793 RepID=UPI00201BAE1B|nr:sigma-70 family RNA polymerase sigma factor [Bradyrhizobium sp. dw_78]